MLPTRFGIYLPPQFVEFRNKLDLILLCDSFWDFMMVCIKPDWVDTSVIPGSGIKPCFSRDVEHSTAPLRARTQGKLFLGHWCCACDPDADDAATSISKMSWLAKELGNTTTIVSLPVLQTKLWDMISLWFQEYDY